MKFNVFINHLLKCILSLLKQQTVQVPIYYICTFLSSQTRWMKNYFCLWFSLIKTTTVTAASINIFHINNQSNDCVM